MTKRMKLLKAALTKEVTRFAIRVTKDGQFMCEFCDDFLLTKDRKRATLFTPEEAETARVLAYRKFGPSEIVDMQLIDQPLQAFTLDDKRTNPVLEEFMND